MIGLELGSVYARMGTKVSVVDVAGTVLSSMDSSLGKSIGAGFGYNLKKGNKRVFTRLGILVMHQRDLFGDKYYGFGIVPTFGFGFNFL